MGNKARVSSSEPPRTGHKTKSHLQVGDRKVSDALQLLADGHMDDIIAENDTGHGNRLIVSTGPEFGDGPGLYFRVGSQWFKVASLAVTFMRPPRGISNLIGNTIGLDVAEMAISNEVGRLDIVGSELTATDQDTVHLNLINGTISLISGFQTIEIPELQFVTGQSDMKSSVPIGLTIEAQTDHRVGRSTWQARQQNNPGLIIGPSPPPTPTTGIPFVVILFAASDQPNMSAFNPTLKHASFVGIKYSIVDPNPGATLANPRTPHERPSETVFKSRFGPGAATQKNFFINDIEILLTEGNPPSQQMINDHVDWATWTREVAVQAVCGLYGPLPYSAGSEFVGTAFFNAAPYTTIRSRNDLLEPIYNAVEATFPSLYRHFLAFTTWQRATHIKVYECVRKAPTKPCVWFLNPRYHSNPADPNVAPFQSHTKAEFLEMLNEADACARGQRTVGPAGDTRTLRCDGVIIWGEPAKPWVDWRGRGWWDAVQTFFNFDDPADPGPP